MSEGETMTTTTETVATTTETWTYGGVRVLRDGKRAHAWVDPSGEELLYQKIGRRAAVGYLYEATVERDGDHITLHGQPRSIGEQTDAETRLRLRAADSAATTRLATLARERKEGAEDALNEALAPLVKLARGCRTGAERDALIATVLRRMQSAAWS